MNRAVCRVTREQANSRIQKRKRVVTCANTAQVFLIFAPLPVTDIIPPIIITLRAYPNNGMQTSVCSALRTKVRVPEGFRIGT